MKRLFCSLMLLCMFTPITHAGITSVAPNSASQGDMLWVTITGIGTQFGQGSGTVVTFEQGTMTSVYTITASAVNVSSSSILDAYFSIPGGAPLGSYDVQVEEVDLATYRLTAGFKIVEPSVCGDADNNGSVNLADAVFLVNYVFSGGQPPMDFARADVNCDGKIDLLDISILMGYIFRGGSAPCSTCP
ncbi:MAG: dockerin type I domain-containing protein [Candidatus Zixiibacteriota bacterium]